MIVSHYKGLSAFSWVNEVEAASQNQQFLMEGEPKSICHYSLLHIHLDLVKVERPLNIIVKRVDVIGSEIFILEKLSLGSPGLAKMHITLQLPSRYFENKKIAVYHTLISKDLIAEGEIGYRSVSLVEDEKSYHPRQQWERNREEEKRASDQYFKEPPLKQMAPAEPPCGEGSSSETGGYFNLYEQLSSSDESPLIGERAAKQKKRCVIS